MKTFTSHAEMLAAISAARADALADAKQACGRRGTYRSRGTWALTVGKGGREGPLVEASPNDCWATQKAFNALIADVVADHPLVTQIYVEGGYDYAESPRAMNDGDYDPEVSTWEVLVWERAASA